MKVPFIWTHEAHWIDDLCLLRGFMIGNDFEDLKDKVWITTSAPVHACATYIHMHSFIGHETQAIFHISWRIEVGSCIVWVGWCSWALVPKLLTSNSYLPLVHYFSLPLHSCHLPHGCPHLCALDCQPSPQRSSPWDNTHGSASLVPRTT